MSKGRRAKKVVDVDSAMKKGTICPHPNTPTKKRLIGPPFLYVLLDYQAATAVDGESNFF